MDVPPVAIQWLAQNAFSDVELARLSNVSKEWRRQVGLALSDGSSTSRLLLPSMIRFARMHQHTTGTTSLQSNTIISAEAILDTFCAAWFPPSGIQPIPVSTLPLDHQHDSAPSSRSQGGVARNRYCCFEWRGYHQASHVLSPFGYDSSFVDGLLSSSGYVNETGRQPSAVVRGATLARPEGYCECWDDKTDETGVCHTDTSRQLRRTFLQRQLLPRVIRSSYWKDTWNPTLVGQQQRAVQFLNASGSSALRLLTPPFACGPLTRQITILCVGIATEDGCFLSGLSRRCDFGHMHPQSEVDSIIDMSPVCICCDGTGAAAAGNSHTQPPFEEECDDDSSAAPDAPDGCNCAFNTGKQLFDAESVHDSGDDDAKPPDYVHVGRLGPGRWHCYVAVIDGSESTIRIDGSPESMTHYINDDARAGPPVLDGLTIGSDHCFNMSLCFGEGAPGEGEGSISELVVFQGRLPLCDLEALEDHLMQKHGITPTTKRAATADSDADLLQQEDEWKRLSRALIEQSAPYDSIVVPEGVPLRVVANDPSVSWHRNNAVTGERIQVARIGSRLSQGSSDW